MNKKIYNLFERLEENVISPEDNNLYSTKDNIFKITIQFFFKLRKTLKNIFNSLFIETNRKLIKKEKQKKKE